MKGRSNRRAAATLAALAVGALAAGNASGASGKTAGSAIESGIQSLAGGIVTDVTGGYYDPARSVYVPAAVAPGGPGAQRIPGGIVTDDAGGSYDPARSVYVQHPVKLTVAAPAAAIEPLEARGFSWADASLGAGAGAAAILALAGAALVTTRARRKPAI